MSIPIPLHSGENKKNVVQLEQPTLTPKQQKTVNLIADGKTEPEIAKALKIGLRTVQLWKSQPHIKAAVARALDHKFKEITALKCAIYQEAVVKLRALVKQKSVKAITYALEKFAPAEKPVAADENMELVFGLDLDHEFLKNVGGKEVDAGNFSPHEGTERDTPAPSEE